MIVSRLILKNWRNFQSVDVPLGERVFLAGPNASGKSNLLDVFRFLRDIAKPGGGLQKAVSDRGGFSRIRCLAARRYPDIELEIHLSNKDDKQPEWRYSIGIKQEVRGYRQPILSYEKVWVGDQQILNRPDNIDLKDKLRLTQTHLEQINANAEFREIARFFESVLYLHLIPQLLRFPKEFSGPGIPGDPFGRSFLERVSKTSDRARQSRLNKIELALRSAVPQLKHLTYVVDTEEGGVPHLEAIYEHWRMRGARQREDQFSDGTLRLIGLLWSLLESDSLLLLEEPELSLHPEIVKKLAALIHRLQKQKKRQVILSTHSTDLLSDKGIGGDEVLLLIPGAESTQVRLASSFDEIRALLEGGLSIAEAALPYTVPDNIGQLEIFK
ncbi:MAG: AAA family ATPase [candidate division KSB1 bacterium]|nr:AAA family ATPase [candidate division KSB1 bacterium]MDZ7340391.1 AAA family ATPase [candidate division KSB1 bacterium]